MSPSKSSSETARVREVFKYYQPTDSLLPADEPERHQAQPPRSSHDAALTAFAQLGALRLNAKRGMISLVGAEVQYVIAEATRTLSLQSDDVHDSEDELWLGCQTIPRSEGLCADAVKNFTEKYDEAPSYFIVNDLAKHDQYKDQYFVTGKPHNRFYAGVPIRTSAGYVIGAYSVVDDKPRGGLNQVEATFLKDMAMTVMGHLELTRVEHQHHRAEKMLKGIGLFVEGKSSLREWWLKTGHLIRGSEAKSDDQGVGSLSEQADGLFGVDPNELESRPSSGIEGMKSSSEPPDKPERDPVSRRHSTTSTVELKDSEAISSMGQESGMSTKADASPLDTASAESPDNVTASRLQDSLISRDVVEMFSRASSLIREAIGVDGAIFLDASVGAFGGGTDRAGMSENISTAFKLGGIQWNSSSSEDERQKSASEGTHGEAEVYLSTNHAPAEPCSLGLTPSKREKMCGILGYSTKIRPGQYTNEDLKVKHSFPERFLRKLLKRYPLGKIFNFEDDGSTSSSEGEHCQAPRKDYTPMVDTQSDVVTEARQRLTRKMSYESEAKSLRQMLPGVRSAAMFPLWDAHKERWFAGSLVWTTSSTRALDPIEDLTYLAAFGNSIMAEVARLNALIADQMKADFISSISHELRSPLHGVLAGVEFLQDSPLDPQQEDMVSTINACGRTLLDTIDHVLDFTKTNSFLKPKRNDKRRKKNGRRFRGASPEKETLRTNAPDDYSNDHSQIDLGVLTEEVIDSILAGRVYGHASSSSSSLFHSTSEWTEPDSKRSKGTRAVSVSKDWVMVIVDIDWRSSWMFKAHPGAWRRILMNLFGNALKYTSAGFVRVSLSCRDTTSAPGQVTKSVIYLSVVDSGKGISKEFLRHQLYTPFVQENPLATGTGLGLSIVRQIVDAYGGVIEFNSEQGSGTEVKISLTLDNAMPSASLLADSSETVITKVRKTTRGLKACLIAFDVYPNIVGTQTGRPSVEAERMLSLRSSLASHLTNWFEMEVTFSPALNSSSGDIAIAMESEVISSILQGADDVIAESKEYLPGTSEGSPLIVLRATASPSPRPISNNNQVLVYVQEPYGPHKLAKALTFCLDRRPLSSTGREYQELRLSSPRDLVLTDADSDLPSGDLIDERPGITASQHLNENRETRPRRSSESSLPPYDTTRRDDSQVSPGIPPLTIPLKPSNLPVTSSDHQSKQSAAHKAPLQYPQRPSLLLVEDNDINLKLLVVYMQRIGYEHAIATNGLQALQRYQNAPQKFDVILMDISMPVMDGITSTREIRKFEHERRISPATIIAITGAASASVRQEAYSNGIDLFLTKPVAMKQLKRILEEWKPKSIGKEDEGSSNQTLI